MNVKQHYLWMVTLYLTGTVLIILLADILASVFIVLVLFVYHLIAFSTFKMQYINKTKEEKERLLYRLDQTQKETHEVATQFTSLSELIDSGLLLIDDEERIKQVNKTFSLYFDKEDLLDKSYDVLSDIKGLYKAINEAYLQEHKVRLQIEYNQAYYDVNISPIFEGTRYRGCLVVVHDITQLKTAETFQKQFTADVSHELKTPLSAIKGISEILANNPAMDQQERKEFIDTMMNESARLETILNDLLIISKMDRLDYELKLEKTDIEALIDEAIQLLKPMASEKDLDLIAELTPIEMMVDSTKFRQVIINLIKNGLNYTDKGYVKIRSFVEKDWYVIEVHDTGIGINEDDRELVFKRFYRVDDARSRASGGSGLGLSIIKNVVKKHDGEIELDSIPNKGSTFRVKLPIIAEKH